MTTPQCRNTNTDSAHGRKGPSEERSDRAIREEQCTNLNARRREIDVDERHDSARQDARKKKKLAGLLTVLLIVLVNDQKGHKGKVLMNEPATYEKVWVTYQRAASSEACEYTHPNIQELAA